MNLLLSTNIVICMGFGRLTFSDYVTFSDLLDEVFAAGFLLPKKFFLTLCTNCKLCCIIHLGFVKVGGFRLNPNFKL